MAVVTKKFSFNVDLENWAFTIGGATGMAGTRDTTEDATNDINAGTGVIQARRTGKNLTNGTSYWEWGNGTLTWEDLGVPAGCTVTAVNLDFDWKCSEYTTGANTSSYGPAELRNSTGATVTGTFSVSATFGATSAWATRAGTQITGLSQASNTAIRLRIGAKPNTGNSVSAAVTLRQDWVVVTITYTPATRTKTFTEDGYMADRISPTFTVDAYLALRTILGFTNDGYVADRTPITFTADGLVAGTIPLTFSVDALIQDTFSKTFTTDGYVANRLLALFSVDGYVASRIGNTFTIDAYVASRSSFQFTVDAYIADRSVKDFTVDGYIALVTTKEFSLDGYVASRTSLDFTVDSIIATRNPFSLTGDGYIAERSSFVFSIDGQIDEQQTTGQKTFLISGYVAKRSLFTFTLDGQIDQAISSKTFSIDGLVLGTLLKTFKVDGKVLPEATAKEIPVSKETRWNETIKEVEQGRGTQDSGFYEGSNEGGIWGD